MLVMKLGLLLFLAAHSVRIFADGWRSEQIARLGEQRWKALYGLVSLLGLALIVWGFGLARAEPIPLWQPPAWGRALTALLTLPAFILLVSAYVPGTHIKARIGHPMMVGTALWAFAHLLANGMLVHVMLFGLFLVWAVAGFVAARRRDRAAGTQYPARGVSRDAMAVLIGLVVWVLFAAFAHRWLIGSSPMG